MDIKTGGEETMTRREREKAAHRKEIMDAAVRVFARRGFGTATLDEVAQEAEFSKGALYLYFTSKEDILFNILYSVSFQNVKAIREVLNGSLNFRDELRSLFVGTAEFAFANRDVIKILMTQNVAGFTMISEEGRRKLIELHEQMVEVIKSRARKAYEDGELRKLPVEAITSMIHGSIDGLATMRWNLGSLEQAKCAVDVFLDILFNGIASEKENCE